MKPQYFIRYVSGILKPYWVYLSDLNHPSYMALTRKEAEDWINNKNGELIL